MSTETAAAASGGLSQQPNDEQPTAFGRSPGAGWYADPAAESQLRRWNGHDVEGGVPTVEANLG